MNPYRTVAMGATVCGGAACDDNAGLCFMSATATEPPDYDQDDHAISDAVVDPLDPYVCDVNNGAGEDEWLEFTVDVTQSATYSIGALTATYDAPAITLTFSGGPPPVTVQTPKSPTTAACGGSNPWHCWVDSTDLATITLSPGKYLMRFTFEGPVNTDDITFTPM